MDSSPNWMISFLVARKQVRKIRAQEHMSYRVNQSSTKRRNTVGAENQSLIDDLSDGISYQQDSSKTVPQAVEAQSETQLEALKDILFGKFVSFLFLIMPFTVWVNFSGDWSDTWVFWLNFIILVPLAAALGELTEDVAEHTNQTIGGLINASLGNAVEIVVSIQALQADQVRLVQSSLLGSILSNLLLVLGCCFFFGGIYHEELRFNSTAAVSNMGLLALSSIALVLPFPFKDYSDDSILTVSRIVSIFLMFMYAQVLFFQLYTHKHIFNDKPDDNEGTVSEETKREEESEEKENDARLSLPMGSLGLVLVIAMVTYFSENLVDSVSGFTDESGMSTTFVGLIILPIIGNAVEHVSAVSVAVKGKMDLAMGVAVGSCTQISLFVVPSAVIYGWIIDVDMSLEFTTFEVTLFVLSIFTVSVVVSNFKGNWLEGSLLITTYILIAVGVWYEGTILE